MLVISALSPRFPLTDQTAIALSNPSGLWKHTPRYISFEEITGSLMKYADNKRERGAGVSDDMTGHSQRGAS